MPNIKEPPGLSRTDGKRPNGLTLIPWRGGCSLVWDTTIIDTVAPSYLHATKAGAAAELAATRKITKYDHLLDSHQFASVAFETLGPISNSGIDFIKDLGKCLTLNTEDIRETAFLFQRLSTTINASMLLPSAKLLMNLTPSSKLPWGTL